MPILSRENCYAYFLMYVQCVSLGFTSFDSLSWKSTHADSTDSVAFIFHDIEKKLRGHKETQTIVGEYKETHCTVDVKRKQQFVDL